MAYITTDDGTRLYYEAIGEGPPIILVHGFASSHSVWERQIEELRGDYQTIAIDLRGHGSSDKEPGREYNIERFSEDILCLANALSLEGCTYIGWSLGAAIGIRYTAKHSIGISKIVLVGGTPCWGQKPDFPYGHSRDQINTWRERLVANRAAWLRQMVDDLFHNKETDPILKDWLWSIAMKLPLHVALEIVRDSAEKDLRPDLPKISQNTAIFHGSYDKFDYLEAAKFMAKTIPNAKLVEFRNSGHSLFLEEPERFQLELKSFLRA